MFDELWIQSNQNRVFMPPVVYTAQRHNAFYRSVRPSSVRSDVTICEHDILQMNAKIQLQMGTSMIHGAMV